MGCIDRNNKFCCAPCMRLYHVVGPADPVGNEGIPGDIGQLVQRDLPEVLKQTHIIYTFHLVLQLVVMVVKQVLFKLLRKP